MNSMISGRRESSGEPLSKEQQDAVVAAKVRAVARESFRELQLTAVHGGLYADELSSSRFPARS